MSTNYVPPQPQPTQAGDNTSAQQNAYTKPQQVNAQQPYEGYSQGYDYQQPFKGYSQGYDYQQPFEGYSQGQPNEGYSQGRPNEGYSQSQPAANYTYNQFPYAQPSYPAAGYAPSTPTQGYSNPQWNTLAILSVVFLFVCMPASLALGFLALSEIKKTGERGKVLAIVSICVSGFFVALLALLLLVWSFFWMVML